ncbi:MAG TPA: hypothetical protein VF216_09800 [Mizugakiibacter sp.]
MDKLPRGVQRRARIGTIDASLQAAALAIKTRGYDNEEPMLVFVSPSGTIYAFARNSISADRMERDRADWMLGMYAPNCPARFVVDDLTRERERLRGQRRREKAA